jgi:hypothetical protein
VVEALHQRILDALRTWKRRQSAAASEQEGSR